MTLHRALAMALSATGLTAASVAPGFADPVACLPEAPAPACAELGLAPRSTAPPGATRRFAPPPRPATAAPATARRPHAEPGLSLPPVASLLRALDLARRELALVDRLVHDLAPGDPRAPQVLQRRAGLVDELALHARVRGHALDEPIHHARRARNTRRVAQLEAERDRAFAEEVELLTDAVATRARIVRDHPGAAHEDEVLFDLASDLDRLHRPTQALAAHRTLLRNHPTSSFVPAALLAVAEHLFDTGELGPARQGFEQVAVHPRSRFVPWARYRQAWCAWNLGDAAGAVAAFTQAIAAARAHPEDPGARAVARQVRLELPLPWAEVGDPRRARETFRPLADGDGELRVMLDRLAHVYLDAGRWDSAISILEDLLAREGPRPERCGWQAELLRAVVPSRPKSVQLAEVRRLLAIDADEPRPAGAVCHARAATSVLDLAIAWHREAVGDTSAAGTGDAATLELAGQLYDAALAAFPDLDDIALEGDAGTRPTVARVRRWQAELLFAKGDDERCGPAFDAVLAAAPGAPDAPDVAYAAAVCYDRALSARARRGVPGPVGLFEAQAIEAFARVECVAPNDPVIPELQLRSAQLVERAGRIEEAGARYQAIAARRPLAGAAAFAARRTLEILQTLAARGRSSCEEQLARDVPGLRAALCEGPEGADADHDGCAALAELELALERRRAGRLAAGRQFREAAAVAIAAADRFPDDPHWAEALYDAAIWLEAARRVGAAIRVRERIVARAPSTSAGRCALYLVGANYHALAIYRQAADAYERFARRFPGDTPERCPDAERQAGTCPDAPAALRHAAIFRLGLGETDAALADARDFERLYGARRPAEAAEVSFAMGSIHESAADYRAARAHWDAWLRRWARRADPGRVLQAHVALGRAAAALRDPDAAERSFHDALALWDAGLEAHVGGDDEADRRARRLAARSAAAEARFALADALFERFVAVPWRPFRGGPFRAWLERDFARWHSEKRARLDEAIVAFDAVGALLVPHWQIAAAARVGEMVRRFFTAFREAPVPPEVRRDPDLLAIYQAELDRVSEPWRRAAIGRFRQCLERAADVRWFNDWSSRCEDALHHLEPRQYPLAAEARAQAVFVPEDAAQPTLAMP